MRYALLSVVLPVLTVALPLPRPPTTDELSQVSARGASADRLISTGVTYAKRERRSRLDTLSKRSVTPDSPAASEVESLLRKARELYEREVEYTAEEERERAVTPEDDVVEVEERDEMERKRFEARKHDKQASQYGGNGNGNNGGGHHHGGNGGGGGGGGGGGHHHGHRARDLEAWDRELRRLEARKHDKQASQYGGNGNGNGNGNNNGGGGGGHHHGGNNGGNAGAQAAGGNAQAAAGGGKHGGAQAAAGAQQGGNQAGGQNAAQGAGAGAQPGGNQAGGQNAAQGAGGAQQGGNQGAGGGGGHGHKRQDGLGSTVSSEVSNLGSTVGSAVDDLTGSLGVRDAGDWDEEDLVVRDEFDS